MMKGHQHRQESAPLIIDQQDLIQYTENLNQQLSKNAFSYTLQKQSNSSMNNSMVNQLSLSQSFNLNQGGQIYSINTSQDNRQHHKNDTIDSNGNIIRGRKVDSPQLVVVKELRDLEDQEEVVDYKFRLQGYGSGNSGFDEDLVKWQTKDKSDIRFQKNIQKHKSQSQENKKKSKSKQSKAKLKEDLQKDQKFMVQKQKGQKQQQKDEQDPYQKYAAKGIKSQRDIRSSMGFNELLNQLDKDISIQQSNQMDFKNRTTYDLLKLELSGIRRQNSSSGNINQQVKSQQKTNTRKAQDKAKSKSRSQERKPFKDSSKRVQNGPKSILKKNDQKSNDQIFSYALNNLISDITPEKNQGVHAASFLQSEHGRCVTSQGVHQSQQFFQQNGRTLSQQNMGYNNVIVSKVKNNNYVEYFGASQNENKLHKDQSSPDRSDNIQIKSFKAFEKNIDKLVRDNIKKMKNKEDEEKLNKLQSEDKQKKKREMLEQNNNRVRILNKEKTYRKQGSQIPNFNNQQSQDFNQEGFNFNMLQISKWDDKFKQLNKQIKKENFIQKSSQSQKIDLQKIKESSNPTKIKKVLNLKNHRKSYGLEFIDIKKEIQEELRTIDLKFKNNEQQLTFNNEISFHLRNKGLSANNTDFSAKKLKVKRNLRYGETQTKENTINEFNTERQEQPQKIEKVIVIKKSKIRRFMNKKKKEKMKEQNQQRQDEILKTIKMQENISKLNQFCKKNLQKQVVIKKRNTTLQQNLDNHLQDLDQNVVDFSKLSGRKLVFDYSKNIQNSTNFDNKHHTKQRESEGDSSRLSTDFYEEYFRLLNSIKKEQNNENMSRAENFVDLSISNNITRSNIVKSPSNNKSMSALQISSSMTQKQMVMLSPKNNQANNETTNFKKQSSQNKVKRTKSKGNLENTKPNIPTKQSAIQKGLKNKDRAESAPLLVGIQRQKKKSDATSQKKKTRKPILTNIQDEQIILQQQHHAQLQYILNQIVIIQRAYRAYLTQRGFYEQSSAQFFNSNSQDYQTQILIQQPDTNDKIQRINDEIKENIDQLKQEQRKEQQKISSDFDEDFEEGEEEIEDEEDDEVVSNMIIINQQSNEDDKKIVYLSNINSCSLPQTPKNEDQQNQSSQIVKNDQNKKVFEYKPDIVIQQNQYFSQNSSQDENTSIYQAISNKPSIEQQSTIIHKDITSKNNLELPEEIKNNDYEMRLFTGSESLLREFKMNTPSQQQQLRKESISESSLKNLTSHNSQNSLTLKQQQLSSVVDSKKSNADQTSHSSQSLFDRNSFQQFTMSKMQQMLKSNEFMNLIQMREKALEYRQEKETKFIKKMLKNKQFSPRTYNQKKESLEKWVRFEKEEIQKTKKQLQEEWQKTIQIIEETQKNVDLMREKMKINTENNKYHQQLFNSQSSRNSSASYITSKKDDLNRKSINEVDEQPPISQRSYRLSHLSSQNFDLKTKNQKQSFDLKPQQKQQANDQLLDFLENNWQKNQQKEVQKLSQPHVDDQRQGIYIEDQNLLFQSSTISENNIQNDQEFSQEKLINELNIQQNQDDERPLVRSRSEQDLSDLITKHKISLEDLQEEFKEERGSVDIQKLNEQESESFRILESERSNNNQQIFNKINSQIPDIKIQENLYDDSSKRISQLENNEQDFQSNDSLLNESELNNYFQDQKFSIEDFKSLDKRKLIAEDEDVNIPQREISHEFMDKYDDSSSQIHDESIQEKQTMFPQPQLQPKNEEKNTDQEPVQYNLKFDEQRTVTPEVQSTAQFFQNQQAMIFQNAKPGENIKISDILKKTQNLTDSYMNDSQNTSQIVFQNQQINQSMQLPYIQPLMSEQEVLAEKLTNEIIQQLLSQEIKVPQRKIENIEQKEEPLIQAAIQQVQIQTSDNQDVFIIDAQMNEKETRRELAEFKQRLMIEQDLIRVENYINEVINALQFYELQYLQNLQNYPINQQELSTNFHRQFLSVLTAPIKKNELDMLNHLQTSEIGSYEHFETAQDMSSHPILPVDLYLDIERQREENQLKTLMINIDHENSVLAESTHIHNKAIFDSLNESLMKFRPYGIQGEPMPWSNKNRRLQTKVDTSQVDTERLFFMVKQDVMRWSQTFAGCHPSQTFIFKRNENTQDNGQFDEELFQETRERRLAQMLAQEVVETEHQWLNYEFEEAQVKIDLSDMILEHLVEEAVVFLNQKKEINNEQSIANQQI